MANQITGRILHIFPAATLTTKSGQPFTKRDIVIDCTRFDPYTGERSSVENTPMLTFTGDRISLLDGFQPGQIVTIDFDVQGRAYERDDHSRSYAVDLRGFRIALRGQTAPKPSQPQPATAAYQPAPAPSPAPSQPAPAPARADGLPF